MRTSTQFPFDLQRWNAQHLTDAVPRRLSQQAADAMADPASGGPRRLAIPRSYLPAAAPRLFLMC